MFKVKNRSITDAFQNKFHLMITLQSMYNFKEHRFNLKTAKFAISSCGPPLWNEILDNNTKAFTSSSFLQKTLKNKLMNPENVVSLF